jgi:hypothetical protein
VCVPLLLESAGLPWLVGALRPADLAPLVDLPPHLIVNQTSCVPVSRHDTTAASPQLNRQATAQASAESLLRRSGRSAQTATTSYSVSCVRRSTSMSVFCRRRARAARPSRRAAIDSRSSPVSWRQRMNRSCTNRHPLACQPSGERPPRVVGPWRGIIGQLGGLEGGIDGSYRSGRKLVSLSAQRVDRSGHVRLPPRSPCRALGRIALLLVNDQDTAAHQRIVSSHSPRDRRPPPTRQNHPTLICSTEAR